MLRKALPIITVILFSITIISCIMIANTIIRSNADIEDFESLAALIQTTPTEETTDEMQNNDGEAIDIFINISVEQKIVKNIAKNIISTKIEIDNHKTGDGSKPLKKSNF